jgi:6-pyruvoyl-tetrahydropterin synthase
MYTAIVEDSFEATHAVRMPDGSFERPHSHRWGVRAEFQAAKLDPHDMVVDFCAVQDVLRDVLAKFEQADLNRVKAFAGCTPTAEAVARVIFDAVRQAGLSTLRRVLVTEAPGCSAAYEADRATDWQSTIAK